MTPLHQAAQKAVDKLKQASGGLAYFLGVKQEPRFVVGSQNDIRAVIDSLESALQQQPEPEAPIGWLYDWTHSSALGKPDEQFAGFTTDEAYARKHDNPRAVYTAPPALQHQEVPREPVATTRIENGFVKVTWHSIPPHGTKLYASPSTTRQQEAGSDTARLDWLERERAEACKRGYQWNTWAYDALQSDLTIREQIDKVLAAAPSTPENADKPTE